MSLTELALTFANNLLPVMLISAGGFVIGKYLSIDSRSVGRIVFYFFSPLLVFNLLVRSLLPLSEILQTIALSSGVMAITGLLALGGGLMLRLERPTLVAVLVTAMFANNGNYGLPLISFAFGEDGLAHASIYFVTTSILFNTVGVLIASLGHLSFRQALVGLLRVPTVYAVVVAILMNRLGWQLPMPLDRTLSLAAAGTIPLMIFLLGLELQRAQWTRHYRALGLAAGLRLLVGPLVGFALTGWLGMNRAGVQGGVVEAAMPSAVSNAVLASEFKLDSSLVTATIFVSTLLSPLTLTPLLVILSR